MMVSPVDQLINDFADAGADYITFHPEATQHIDRSLQLVRSRGCKSGLVFNPGTPLDCLKYVMDKVDIVLLMSVNPGFGGQSFIPGTLDKLKEARALITEAGADMFVAGSAIFNTEDYKATIDGMREELAKVPFPGKAKVAA